jgi:hypothetical protein
LHQAATGRHRGQIRKKAAKGATELDVWQCCRGMVIRELAVNLTTLIMKRVLTSRREFLRQSSAALTAGCALGAFGRRVVADAQGGLPESKISHQAVACSRRDAACVSLDILSVVFF